MPQTERRFSKKTISRNTVVQTGQTNINAAGKTSLGEAIVKNHKGGSNRPNIKKKKKFPEKSFCTILGFLPG